tara:strand:- start:914 stop:2128 length:1215 start_codon:yes stop_codon:yes gene_type:complete
MIEKSRLKILACPANEGGCAYYRVILPMSKLQEKCGEEVEIKQNLNPLMFDAKTGKQNPEFTEDEFKWADVVFLQNIHNFGAQYTIDIIKTAQKNGCLVHYDNDDLLTDLYKGHRLYKVYQDQNLSELTKTIYAHVDLVSVTQSKFAERIAPYVKHALVIIRNAIDFDLPCWNAPKIPTPKKITRIGWVGGIHHEEDVKEFPAICMATNSKVGPEKIHWGFYGRPPMPMKDGKPNSDWQQDVWDNYERILTSGMRHKNYKIYQAMPSHDYGRMYTNIDIAIAPLQYNEFNDSKSEIKLMEAGRYGIPLIATNCGAYDDVIKNGEHGYLISKDNPRSEWVKCLSKTIKDRKHREEMGKNLKSIVDENYDINKTVSQRLRLYRDILKARSDYHEKLKQESTESKDS